MAGSLPASVGTTSAPSTGRATNHNAALAVLTTLFFMWGFLTCLNDIIIPHLKAVFELNYAKAMLIQFAFFTAYFVMSLPSGKIVTRFGYKNGIIIGLCGAAVGCLLFFPAAGERSYALFLFALFVLASGITLLQVAANPFVAVLGKPETASSRLTLTQAFNSLGTTIAPQFGSLLILSTAAKSAAEIKQMSPAAADAYRLAEASSVQTPYLGLAAALVVLALAIAMFKLPKIEDVTPTSIDAGGEAHRESAWGYRAPGARRGRDLPLRRRRGRDRQLPRELLQGAEHRRPDRGRGGPAGLVLLGRCDGRPLHRHGDAADVQADQDADPARAGGGHARRAHHGDPRKPGDVVDHRGRAVQLDHVPHHLHPRHRRARQAHQQGSGILCMAIVGGAIVPVLQGALADTIGIHYGFVIPVLCYLYIAWYGAKGIAPARHATAS